MQNTAPKERLALRCQTCKSLLGTVLNYANHHGLVIYIPCPCGGTSQGFTLGALYKVEADGKVSNATLADQLIAALSRARQQQRPGQLRQRPEEVQPAD